MNSFEPAVLRPKEAARYLGVGTATFWRFVKNDPTFPRTFKITAQATAIYKKDLDAWLHRRRMGA